MSAALCGPAGAAGIGMPGAIDDAPVIAAVIAAAVVAIVEVPMALAVVVGAAAGVELLPQAVRIRLVAAVAASRAGADAEGGHRFSRFGVVSRHDSSPETREDPARSGLNPENAE